MIHKIFQPTPSPIVMAMWQMLGRLHLPLRSTVGISWKVYTESGGPAKFIRGRKRGERRG